MRMGGMGEGNTHVFSCTRKFPSTFVGQTQDPLDLGFEEHLKPHSKERVKQRRLYEGY